MKKIGQARGRIGWELGSDTFNERHIKRVISVAKVCADVWTATQKVECPPSTPKTLGSIPQNLLNLE